MSDTEKLGESEDWTVVTEEKTPRSEPAGGFDRSSDGGSAYSEKESFEDEVEADHSAGHMPVNLALEEGVSHLDIPSEYSVPEVEGEMESDMPYGVMDITVVGVVKGGKTSLANAISNHLCSRGWTVSERDEENERVQLKLEGSSNILMISSANAEKRSLSVKNLNVCVFALPPHYTSPTVLADMETLMTENDYDLLLPVICKVDTMTVDELSVYKEELQSSMPKKPSIAVKDIFGVVCKERTYSWGSITPTSDSSQLLELCNALESHLQVDTSERLEPPLLQLPDTSTLDPTAEAAEKTGSLKEAAGNRAAACLFALLVALVYAVLVLDSPWSFPEIARNAYSFEVLLFVIILTPLGPQKEFSVVLAIACAIFWRLAEETRQKEVEDMSLSYEKLFNENERSTFLLNSCELQLQECADNFQNVSIRLYDTAERLSMALELCGSWCLEV